MKRHIIITGGTGKVKRKNVDFLQGEILVLQIGKLHLGGTGRGAAQRVVLKRAAMGDGGHDPLFGAGDLIVGENAATGAIGATGLHLVLKQ